jgi:hypothetical protein
MNLTGRGFKERFRARRQQQKSRRIERAQGRTSIQYGSDRFGGKGGGGSPSAW